MIGLARNNRFLSAAVLCLLFLISFSYLLCGYRYFDLKAYLYDEGIVVTGALRILEGGIPYRDFWTLYAPGEFYALAGIFKIFGISLKTVTLFTIVILSLIVCSVYIFIKRLCAQSLSVLALLFSLGWLKSYMVYNRPWQLAILFYILCCFTFLNFINSNRNKWLVITGILLGMMGIFRQDFGFYIFNCIFLVVLLKELNFYKDKGWKDRLAFVVKKEIYFISGSLIILLPLFLGLIFNSALKEFVRDTVFFPIAIYPKVRSLPFPQLKLHTLEFYLPLFVFLSSGIRLLFYGWSDKAGKSIDWLTLFLLLSGISLFNYSSTRSDKAHLLPTMIIAILLFTLSLDRFLKNNSTFFRKSIMLFLLFALSFILLFFSAKPAFLKIKYLYKHKAQTEINIARAKGFYDGSEHAQSQAMAIRYIQDNTEQNEKIFIGNSKHDKVLTSDVLFYFLSERLSATKYYELHPGLTNTRGIQEQIVNDIIKANVRYIVLWAEDPMNIYINEPNDSSKSSGVNDLDDFIKEKYQIEKKIGNYLILCRR